MHRTYKPLFGQFMSHKIYLHPTLIIMFLIFVMPFALPRTTLNTIVNANIT